MNLISLDPKLTELYKLNKFIKDELGNENLQIDLIVEEVFVNIVNYSKTDYIKVNVEFENPTLMLTFIDNGREFNPLLEKDHEIPMTIEDAEIGGLGIFLTKELADELHYQRISNENHLKIIKNVE